jgi:hypothetical protein
MPQEDNPRGDTALDERPEAFGFGESRKRLLSALRWTEPEVLPLSFRLHVAAAVQLHYSGGVLR